MNWFCRKLARPVKVGDIWRRIYREENPFEEQGFVDRTVLEIRGEFAECALRYPWGEPSKHEVVTTSYLKMYSKLLNP